MENRKFHHYEKWEDYKAGFYDNVSGKNKILLIDKVIELFNNSELTEKYMRKVINEWVYSCEQNLTNNSMNKVAYLGQAACCIFAKIPSSITMEAWSKITKENRDKADFTAKYILKEWEEKNA